MGFRGNRKEEAQVTFLFRGNKKRRHGSFFYFREIKNRWLGAFSELTESMSQGTGQGTGPKVLDPSTRGTGQRYWAQSPRKFFSLLFQSLQYYNFSKYRSPNATPEYWAQSPRKFFSLLFQSLQYYNSSKYRSPNATRPGGGESGVVAEHVHFVATQRS